MLTSYGLFWRLLQPGVFQKCFGPKIKNGSIAEEFRKEVVSFGFVETRLNCESQDLTIRTLSSVMVSSSCNVDLTEFREGCRFLSKINDGSMFVPNQYTVLKMLV